MTTPVKCSIASARPGKITYVYALSPDHPHRNSGVIEFNDLAVGHSYLIDLVKGSLDWEVSVDGNVIAKGHECRGEVLGSVSKAQPHYLVNFLEWLLTTRTEA